MSLILDALKRAERERQSQGARVLADLPQTPPAPRPAHRWRIAGIVVLVLIAGALLWTALREAPRTEPDPVAPAVAETPAPPAPRPAVIPGTEAVASLDDLTDEPAMAEPDLPPSAPPSLPAPVITAAPAPRPQAESPAPNNAPAAVSAENPPTAAAEDPAQAAAPLIPPALTQPAPRRKLREMPPAYRADFPVLNVEVHVYEPATGKRMVMVNGRRYREGERLAEGPQVVEIVSDGIVLEHRGETVLFTLGR